MKNKLEKRLRKVTTKIQIDDLVEVIKIVASAEERTVNKIGINEISKVWHIHLPKTKSFIEYEEVSNCFRKGSEPVVKLISREELSIGEVSYQKTSNVMSILVGTEIRELIDIFLRKKDEYLRAWILFEEIEDRVRALYRAHVGRREAYVAMFRRSLDSTPERAFNTIDGD